MGTKKRPRLRTSFGLLNVINNNIRFRTRHQIDGTEGGYPDADQIYVATYNYNNRLREDWYGASIAYAFGENFGLGVTTFLTTRNYVYSNFVEAHVLEFDTSVMDYRTYDYFGSSTTLDGVASGFLWKIGLAYEFNDYKLGLTVTTPRVQANFLGRIFFNQTLTNFTTRSQAVRDNISVQHDKLNSTYHSPGSSIWVS